MSYVKPFPSRTIRLTRPQRNGEIRVLGHYGVLKEQDFPAFGLASEYACQSEAFGWKYFSRSFGDRLNHFSDNGDVAVPEPFNERRLIRNKL